MYSGILQDSINERSLFVPKPVPQNCNDKEAKLYFSDCQQSYSTSVNHKYLEVRVVKREEQSFTHYGLLQDRHNHLLYMNKLGVKIAFPLSPMKREP